MKKILFALLLLALCGSLVYADEFNINVEYGMASDISATFGGVKIIHNDPGGLGIGVSYFAPINERVEIGGGATFFLPKTIKGGSVGGFPFIITTDANFSYLPVFGRIKFIPRPDSNAKFYVGGDLRYAIMSVSGAYFAGSSVQGGLGFGLFGGVKIEGFLVELGYIMQNGTLEIGGSKSDFTDNYIYLKGGYSIL